VADGRRFRAAVLSLPCPARMQRAMEGRRGRRE
jgi:hypothetical protein